MKKLIAIALVLVLMLGVLPAAAFADDGVEVSAPAASGDSGSAGSSGSGAGSSGSEAGSSGSGAGSSGSEAGSSGSADGASGSAAGNNAPAAENNALAAGNSAPAAVEAAPAEAPVVEAPAVETQAVEVQAVEVQAVEAPVVEEAAAEEIVAEAVTTDEITTEEIISEEVINEEITSEEITTEEITSEELTTEEIAPEAPAAEEESNRRYEVDFHFDGQKYVMEGGSSNSLDAILAALGLEASIADVSSSNPDLFSCSLQDGAWVISANNAFDTNESLTITLADGSVLELLVTDDQYAEYYNNADKTIVCTFNETTGTLTCTLNDEAEAPDISWHEGETSEERYARLEQYAIKDVVNSAGESVLSAIRNSIQKIVVGFGVTGIGWTDTLGSAKGVFQEAANLKEVEIEEDNSLLVLGWSAFRKDKKMDSFNFENCDNLEWIRQQAFSPTAITEADLSNCVNLTTIDHAVFGECDKLVSVTLPGNLSSIGQQAFIKAGIKTITWNAADCTTILNGSNRAQNGLNGSASAFMSKASDYTLVIGSDVETLPANFFQAMGNAGKLVIEDEDGNTYTIDVDRLNQTAPFTSLSGKIRVDGKGALYNANGETLNYLPEGMSEYVLPSDSVSVSSYVEGQVSATVTYKVTAPEGSQDAGLPGFTASGTVLVLNDQAKHSSFGSSALSATAVTAMGSDGREHSYELAGWMLPDGSVIGLGEEVALDAEAVELVSVWKDTTPAAPAEEAEEAEEPAEAAENTEENIENIEENIEKVEENEIPLNNTAANNVGNAANNIPAAPAVEAEEIEENEMPLSAASGLVAQPLGARTEISGSAAPAAAAAEAPAANNTLAAASLFLLLVALALLAGDKMRRNMQ